MLDQPILSFKNMSSTGVTSEAVNTTASEEGEYEAALGAMNNGENTKANNQFATVLKDTQTKMRIEGSTHKEETVVFNVSEPVKTDLLNKINLSTLPTSVITNSDVDVDTLSNEQKISPEIDLDLNLTIVDDKIEDISVMNVASSTVKLTDSPDDTTVVDTPTIIAAIQPLDTTDTLKNRLSPLVEKPLDNTKPLLQTSHPSLLSDAEQTVPIALSITKTTPISAITTVDSPLQSASSPLVNMANKGQFLQQLDKAVTESLNAQEPSIDVDILKDLSINTQAPISRQAAQTSTSTIPLAVTIPFQQAQWGTAVAEKVMWLSSHGLQEAEIQLDPPELGPLQVKVSVENDQAHVSFVVQHSNVKEALEQTATRLREMFEAEGIDLVDVDVSDQSAQQEQEHDEELANALFGDDDSTDGQTQESGDPLVTSYINSPNGIDAYV